MLYEKLLLDKTTVPAMEWLMVFDLPPSPGKSK